MTNPTPALTLQSLQVRGVQVPMALPLHTGGGRIDVAPLALIDLLTDQGVTGSTYLFCYTPRVLKPVLQLLAEVGDELAGAAVAPLDLDRRLRALPAAGRQGCGRHGDGGHRHGGLRCPDPRPGPAVGACPRRLDAPDPCL